MTNHSEPSAESHAEPAAAQPAQLRPTPASPGLKQTVWPAQPRTVVEAAIQGLPRHRPSSNLPFSLTQQSDGLARSHHCCPPRGPTRRGWAAGRPSPLIINAFAVGSRIRTVPRSCRKKQPESTVETLLTQGNPLSASSDYAPALTKGHRMWKLRAIFARGKSGGGVASGTGEDAGRTWGWEEESASGGGVGAMRHDEVDDN